MRFHRCLDTTIPPIDQRVRDPVSDHFQRIISVLAPIPEHDRNGHMIYKCTAPAKPSLRTASLHEPYTDTGTYEKKCRGDAADTKHGVANRDSGNETIRNNRQTQQNHYSTTHEVLMPECAFSPVGAKNNTLRPKRNCLNCFYTHTRHSSLSSKLATSRNCCALK